MSKQRNSFCAACSAESNGVKSRIALEHTCEKREDLFLPAEMNCPICAMSCEKVSEFRLEGKKVEAFYCNECKKPFTIKIK